MRVLFIILFLFAVSDTTMVDTVKVNHDQVDSLSIKLDSLIKILEQKQERDEI